jgi:hypothetical protein
MNFIVADWNAYTFWIVRVQDTVNAESLSITVIWYTSYFLASLLGEV